MTRTKITKATKVMMAGSRGFTLLELVVIIAVIGILAAAVSPAVLQRIMDTRVEATQSEAQALYQAMVGMNDGGSNFGFVGDIGRLPNSFTELVQPGGLPSYTTSTTRGIGMGWRGPYVNTGTSASDYLTDAFGNAYTGASTGQVRSAGPDGVLNTSDDIVYPPAAPTISGTVNVTLKTLDSKGKTIVDPTGYSVELHYASNGAEAVLADANSPFTFTNVPIGVHAIRVLKNAGNAVVGQDTVVVHPGGTATAEIWF